MEGYWEVTYIEINGQGVWEFPDIYFDFNVCKLRERGYCDLTVSDFWGGTFNNGVYNVTHQGDQLNMTIDYDTYKQPYSFDLKRLSDSRMVLENLDPELNTYSIIELRKEE